ncbi:CaiB/BaiF CoA-transferase family protein [Sphaerochaeta sp. PS]|uniref:CaiB/BaiF CoA transferase family protein n=1 Tax=Sphaerochaeta sp. PS TaxID=3076336 RepID=UPI0028A3B0B4|nr:CaiB/BaiF CoA-transferase family protein [Sphaerochaeta sp. PS]MDT4762212.1 CaiB/BaiF CoA-transferase family protein [Sphaerochaeta sp. PS]
MLRDVKVLSFTHYLQGPSAAQTLADLGADVVKVEPTKGAHERSWSGGNTYPGGVSMFFLLGNRNQNSLSIDLKSPLGKEVIIKLISTYDVIIENFRPGVMEKLGLGYEELSAINPRLIYCSCSGYGPSGPNEEKPGQDLIIQGMSGLASITGSRDDAPAPVGTAVVDQHSAVLAALGVVTALFDRERTGRGHKIEASLLGGALDLQLESLGYFMNGGQFTERATTGVATRMHQSPYGIYKTSDGYITLFMVPLDKLQTLCTPGAFFGFTTEDQMSRRLEFDKIVAQEMLKKTTKEWMGVFDANKIWYGPVNSYSEMLEDEQVKYNDNILTIHHPKAGEVRVVGHANKYDGSYLKIRKNPPVLGDYTYKLLKEIGYDDNQIHEYVSEGIVVGERPAL